MTTTHYALLAATVDDAKTHPAYACAAIVITPHTRNKEGLIISGYVMTDAFHDECTRDDARGDVARSALLATKRNAAKGAPVRTLRPATIAETAELIGGL